ncbi:MAG: carbohydrate kinase family protein [Candidatus Bathyarchaeota archaeon]
MVEVLCSGSFLCDIIASSLPRIGDPGDLVYAPKGISLHSGGHAANVAIDLAQLGRSKITVVGAIGEDFLGDFLLSELAKRGLRARPERITGFHTAKNLALVVEGQDRRFIAELSANTMLTPDHVLEAIWETQPSVFYQGTVGGLRNIDPELGAVLTEAKSSGALTFVDVVRPYDGGWEGLRESYDFIDILHCNESEAISLTSQKDHLSACDALIREGISIVLVTLGHEGLIASWGENRLRLPAFKVESIDPTGAGDAFCAGVIDTLLENKAQNVFQELTMGVARNFLLRGSAAGAVCVKSAGATTAVTRRNVESLLLEQGEKVWEGASWVRRRLI